MISSQFCFCIVAYDILTQNVNCERFFIISIFSNAIENLKLHFLKIFLQTKIYFLFISCTRNRHSTMIEIYIKRDDVIKCELDLILTEKFIHYLAFTVHYREDANKLLVVAWNIDRFSQIVVAKTLCWENNYSIFKATRNWTNLFLINDFVKSSIIIWSINT